MNLEPGSTAEPPASTALEPGPGTEGGGEAYALPPEFQAAVQPATSRPLLTDLRQLCAGFTASKTGRAILLLSFTVGLVLVATMVGQVWLNRWNGAFFDAVEHRDLAAIVHQLWIFLGIVAILLSLVVSQTWLHEMTKLRLRDWLTRRLLDDWLTTGRAYRLSISGILGTNPDQRIQEDARHLSELTADLGVGLTHHVFLLGTFVGVLWGMSRGIEFDIHGLHVAIPGYMVWCAILYALFGSGLTWWVGRRLVALNAARYACEADLRFGLVRLSERAEAVALYRGEGDERRIIDQTVDQVLAAVRRLVFALARLTWITSGYGWIAIVLPVIVALPGYLRGTLSLGGLMMVVGAFNQVQQALRWFVDNYARIADWRAALYRVAVFDEAVQNVDRPGPQVETIQILQHPQGHFAFERLSVRTADGDVVIDDASVDIRPGERVLIIGASGSGKSTLFRAVAGLWPWGSGRILIPPREAVMFMPQYPYLPLGTLRAATCYPAAPDAFSTDSLKAALSRVGLAALAPQIDQVARWDRLLSLGQQQRVAFARVVLHRPQWVFLDEATGALDLDNQALVMSIFSTELKDATIVSIGHRPSLESFHTRTLQLTVHHTGARLRWRPSPVVAAAPSRLTRLWSRIKLMLGSPA